MRNFLSIHKKYINLMRRKTTLILNQMCGKFSHFMLYSNSDEEAKAIFNNKTAVVTGGAQGIGKVIVDEFTKHGANVCVIDKQPNDYFVGDLVDESALIRFSQKVIADSGPDAMQHPTHRVGNPMDIANMVLFLCSDKAGFITGENICIDGGMTKQMVYHGDFGWSLYDNKEGI